MPLASLIGAGASILGGVLGASSAKSQQKQNYASQKEFAQHGIRWKVADSKAAGIHPLYGLGAQTHSFQPSALFQTDYGLGQAGQHLGRAIQSKQTKPERALYDLQLQRASAEIDLIKAQTAAAIARTVKQPGQPPPLPASHDSNTIIPTADVDLTSARQTTRQPNVPQATAGNEPLYKLVQSGNNEWHYVVNEKAVEPDSLPGVAAYLRGTVNTPRPPPGLLKPGHRWRYHRWSGTYSQEPIRNSPLRNRQQFRHGR